MCASNSYAEITKDKVAHFYESIVSIRSIVPPEARTAASLGVEREGNGVAIDENHILTIGYIVIESETIEIGLSDGRQLPAKLVGYDHTSGFGIIKSIPFRIGVPSIPTFSPLTSRIGLSSDIIPRLVQGWRSSLLNVCGTPSLQIRRFLKSAPNPEAWSPPRQTTISWQKHTGLR